MEVVAGMSPCEICGILGTCGMDCKALQDGDCENEERSAEWEGSDGANE